MVCGSILLLSNTTRDHNVCLIKDEYLVTSTRDKLAIGNGKNIYF